MKRLLLGGVIMLFCAAVAVPFGNEDQGFVTSDMVKVEKPLKTYPVVDAHTHIGAEAECYELAVKSMDSAGVVLTVNLSGSSGERLDKNLELAAKYPGRFIQFCSVGGRREDWEAPDLGEKFAESIQESYEKGAKGFGEIVKWSLHGSIQWDDPRLEPVWAKLEELSMPINWHVGDPSRYWRPESPNNTLESESYYRKAPLKYKLLIEQERVMEKHPDLVVIAAHSNYLADMIPFLVYRLEKHPNYHIDISATIGEWGRVPEEFVDICKEYPDRILYGTDAGYRGGSVESLGGMEKAVADFKAFHVAHFLFLQTDQKKIPIPFNGNYGRYLVGRVDGFTRYAHDGVALPEEILEKIYYKNAERLFGIKVSE